MPTYLGKTVTDEYMQGLIAEYRAGQNAVGANIEDGDQKVIDRLTAEKVATQPGAHALGEKDGKASASTEAE